MFSLSPTYLDEECQTVAIFCDIAWLRSFDPCSDDPRTSHLGRSESESPESSCPS